MIRPTTRRAALLALLLALSTFALSTPAHAQRFRGGGGRGTDQELTKNGESVKAAFREALGGAGYSTALVKCDGKVAAMGTVVGADGWVLTKASELSGKVTCTPRGAKEQDAEIVGVSEENDLALLKIDAKDLKPIQWGDAAKAEVGQWVMATGPSDTPMAVGVLSVGRRKIPGRSGLMGVMLADAGGEGAGGGAKVAQVVPESPAEKAKLQVDDVITEVNGKAVDSREELVGTVRKYLPGQEIKLSVKRGDKQLDVKVTLAGAVGKGGTRAENMNRMGGELSIRSGNFPAVLQHDTVLQPNQCGGPLVTLDGKAIGINIARAGRVETYAIPADVVTALLADLKSGKLAPPGKTADAAAEKAKKDPASDDE